MGVFWGRRPATSLVTMTDYYIDFYLKNQPEIHGCGLYDLLAVAAALDPSLVTTFGFNAKSILEAPFRGRLPSAIVHGSRIRTNTPKSHWASTCRNSSTVS